MVKSSDASDTFEWQREGDSPCPPEIPLGSLVLESLRKHAKTLTKPAQIEAETATARSYPELLRECVQAAAGWRSLGLTASDTVIIFTRNNHYKYAALLGAVFEGVTLACIVPSANPDEARLLLSRVPTAKAMVCEPNNLQVALQVVPKGIPVFVTADSTEVEGARSVGDLMRLGADVDVDAYQAASVGDVHRHNFAIVFSSGTTGLPKGVLCSNYGAVANALVHPDAWSVVPEDVVLLTSPVSWVTGLFFTLVPIIQGATRVLFSYANETECLDVIRKYKPTMTFIAPARYFLLAGLVKSLRQKGVDVDLSHWRLAMTGGAAMSADLQRTCSEVLGVPIVQAYGCTEHLLLASDSAPPTWGSTGKLAAGVRARLVDISTGRDIREHNRNGELRIKSPYFMNGYIGDPETTAKCVDEQGWYRTGDLAMFDESGHLFVTDRIKELLKFMNLEMTPAEIEDVLVSHPAVKNACVVGRPHEIVGDIPTAFVVLNSGQTVTEKELQDLVKAKLSQNKQLRGGVFFVDEIPMSKNGKYDRIVLRNRLSKLPPVSDQVLGISTA